MATLVLEDLTEDAELDDQALKAISGGRSGLKGAAREGVRLARLRELEQSRLIRGLVKGGFQDLSELD